MFRFNNKYYYENYVIIKFIILKLYVPAIIKLKWMDTYEK